ncbi:winged helix-turn-helix domain-containing protein [Halobaculum sp. MBLA0147]|uniref:winged helix-turn-helix domain-containing protein n=1 Tax=Halobaculum sp. MBLA0147 TaxID=3079934 RepID=UPI003526568A
MTDTQSAMSPARSSDDFDPKAARRENPSGWFALTRYETVRILIDALIESPPGYRFNKSEMERRTGVSREAIRKHIGFLEDLGVVTEVSNGQHAEYELNMSNAVMKEVIELNAEVGHTLSSEEGPRTVSVGDDDPMEVPTEAVNAGDIDDGDNDGQLFDAPNDESLGVLNAD